MWGLIGSLLGGLGGMGSAGGMLGGAGGAAGGGGGLVGGLMGGGAGAAGGAAPAMGAYGSGPNGAASGQTQGLQNNPFFKMMNNNKGGSSAGKTGAGFVTRMYGGGQPDYSFHTQNAMNTGLVNDNYKDVSQNPWGMLGQLMGMGR